MFNIPNWIFSLLSIFSFAAVAYFVVRRADITSIQSQLKQARDDNDELRKRIDDKTKEYLELIKEISVLRADIKQMQAVGAEKDKRISALERVQITQTPSIEQVQYMTDMKNFTTQVHQYMLDSMKLLAQLSIK